jgi:hypothetical protein
LKGSPLFDDFTDGDVRRGGALAFAEKLMKPTASGAASRVRDLKIKLSRTPTAFLQFARNMVARHGRRTFPAPMKALEAVAGSTVTMPFDAGMTPTSSRASFKGLVQTPESKRPASRLLHG